MNQTEVVHKIFHALRHTHTTKLLAAGMPLMDGRRLGHARPGQDKQMANQIAEIYNLHDKEKTASRASENNRRKITKDGLL